MVQIGFGGISAAPVGFTGSALGEAVSRRVQDQQTARQVREPEEPDDGGDRQPTTLIDSRERSDEIRARNEAEDEAVRAAQEDRRREREDREPQPGDRLDLRV